MTKNELKNHVPKLVRDWLAEHKIYLCGAKMCARPVAIKGLGFCDKHFRRHKSGQHVNRKSIYEKSAAERFWPKVKKLSQDNCWLWQGRKDHAGYGLFCPGMESDIQETRVHRFSYASHHGVEIGSLCILHKCDVRLCVNPNHLFIGNRADNSQDKVNKGRQSCGESRPSSKLTENAVRAIRKSDKGTCALAAELNVSPAAISMARNRRTWKHVQ